MSIFLNADSRVLVQGMTGSEGRKHTSRMLASGTKIVGGVTPGKGGQTVEFDQGWRAGVQLRRRGGVGHRGQRHGDLRAGPFTKAAVVEAVEAEIPLCVVITEGVPVKDSAEFFTLTAGLGDPADRAELPGADLARAVQRRHHPRRHHQGRPDRAGLEVGHADLPDDVRAARHRLLHRRRHRR